jgi:hypothetical protein
MPTEIRDASELELRLLRKGMGERAAARRSCVACRRTPLVGERVHVYEDGRTRCELCRERCGEPPIRSETVHGPEHGQAVRLRPAA